MMENTDSDSTKTVKATETTLDILDALRRLDGAGVTELSNHVDCSKAAIHHHLQTLRKQRYVVKEGTTYYLGLRFLGLGGRAVSRAEIYRFGKGEVDDLAEATGETVQVVVEERGKGVYIYQSTGGERESVDTYLGMEVDLHSTAAGKCILAHRGAEYVSAVIDAYGMQSNTPNTITETGTLLDELEDVRETGIAFDDEEHIRGIRCVAAPVTSPQGALLGAVSLSAPVERMDDERFRTTVPNEVQNAVGIIEANIGYSQW
jgi:DNA-binding IclR family transcriptional regulator